MVKYQSKAADFYRKKLTAIANSDNELFEQLALQGEPSYSEGRKSVNDNSSSSSTNYPQEETIDPQNSESLNQRIIQAEEEEKVHDPENLEEAPAEVKPEEKKDWKMKLVHGTQTVISTIEEKAVKIRESEVV